MMHKFVALVMVFVCFIFAAGTCFCEFYFTGKPGQLLAGLALLLYLSTQIKNLKFLWLRI